MTDNIEQEAVMVRYLLGQSPEEERAQVEQRYFSDGEYFDQLLALEDSLIDDFVAGRMSSEQLGAFKESLSVREDDIRFSRALFHAVTKKNLDQPRPEPERRLPAGRQLLFAPKRRLGWVLSIAALALIALGLAFFSRSQTLQNRLSETEAQLDALRKEKDAVEQEVGQARSRSESLERELEIERNKRINAENSLQEQGQRESPDRSSDFATIVFSSSFIPRGATGAFKQMRVSENVRWLRFIIPQQDRGEYESYRVSIKLTGQNVVIDKGALKPTGERRRLVVTVAATHLRPGDYILTLYGERSGASPTELQKYSFRITY